jgi:hypothetical protein
MMKAKGMGVTAYSGIQKQWWIRGGEWIVGKQQFAHLEEADTEADARAKMLIYLLEQGLVDKTALISK